MLNRHRALALALACSTALPLAAQEGSIVASGTGVVELDADRAVVNVAIESLGDTAADAGMANAGTSAEVRAALGAINLPMTAVTTAHYDIQTNWRREDGERTADGYRAVLSLRIEVRDVTRVGTVIDTALNGGANRVDGVQFYSSRTEAARAEATALAVQDALRTAGAMAAAAGGSLGSLIELSSEGLSRVPEPRNRALGYVAAEALPTEITPGTLRVTAHVSGRWKFSGQ